MCKAIVEALQHHLHYVNFFESKGFTLDEIGFIAWIEFVAAKSSLMSIANAPAGGRNIGQNTEILYRKLLEKKHVDRFADLPGDRWMEVETHTSETFLLCQNHLSVVRKYVRPDGIIVTSDVRGLARL